MSAAKDIQGPDPQQLGDREFAAILHLPVEPYTAVVLRDARWTHRGRWHLTGVLHGTAFDIEQLARMDMAEIIYGDKSSEIIRFMITDLVHRVEISDGRLGVYVQDAPRYRDGRSTERRVGMEVDQAVVPRIHKILTELVPDLDDQRRTWLVAALMGWRTTEMAAHTNKLARQLADQNDRHDALAKKIGGVVDDWMIDKHPARAEDCFTKISSLLGRDEKGLPL